jgi:hypothetical protein
MRSTFLQGSMMKHAVRIGCIVASACVWTTSNGAQQTIAPSDPALKAHRVRLGIDTIVVLRTPRDSAEVLSTVLIRRVQRIKGPSQTLLRETQTYESHEPTRPGFSYDTLDADAVTLQPIRSFSTDGKTTHDVRFTGLTFDGVLTTPDSGSRQLHVTLQAAAFPSIMQEAFIAAFPFGGSGSSLSMSMMNPPGASVRPSQLDVVRTDTLRTANGPVPSQLITSAKGAIQIWIAVDDGRMMRMHWTLPNGMSIWKLPKHDIAFRDAVAR